MKQNTLEKAIRAYIPAITCSLSIILNILLICKVVPASVCIVFGLLFLFARLFRQWFELGRILAKYKADDLDRAALRIYKLAQNLQLVWIVSAVAACLLYILF